MRPHTLSLCFALTAASLASPLLAQSMTAAPLVTPFSAAKAGTALPQGWAPIKINDQKKPTTYEFVEDQGAIVLHASADVPLIRTPQEPQMAAWHEQRMPIEPSSSFFAARMPSSTERSGASSTWKFCQ